MAKDGAGFLTFAHNTKEVDYLRLAYIQALNIKYFNPGMKYAVVVDSETSTQLTEKNKKVFDYIIVLDNNNNNNKQYNSNFANECRALEFTPFIETIKLESDLLFTRSIMHWFPAFRLKDVLLSFGAKTYRENVVTSRAFRKFFDDNDLPDVYNGLMYFRYSQSASNFFLIAGRILRNWDYLKEHVLKNCRENSPSTDVLYALTAKVFGIENCIIPTMDFINFVHMKSILQGWEDNRIWTEVVGHQFDNGMIRINNLNQYHPLHYYDKKFISEEMEIYYARQLARTNQGI